MQADIVPSGEEAEVINKFSLACAGVAVTTTAALAADLPSRRAPPVYVPPPPLAIPYSWTGLEFGLTTSAAIPNGQSVTTTPVGGAVAQPSPISLNKGGFDNVGGGVAANYQLHPGSGVVFGAAADVNYFNLHAYEDIFTPAGKANYQERLAYLGTANGRLGYAFNRLLIYAVGGYAWGNVHVSENLYAPAYFGTSSHPFKSGYDVGGGVEYAIPADSILNKLSVEKLLGIDKKLGLDIFEGTIRAEYVHYDLGTETVGVAGIGGAPGGYVARFRTEGNLVRVGLGYKFNGLSGTPAPVVARY